MVTREKERILLHFDLTHCPQDVEFTLNAGDGKHYTLTAYRDAPGKLAEHRRRNRALALIPEEHLPRITHFVEDAELYADGLSLRSVVYPSRDDHPLPELALVFIHIPREHRARAYREMRAKRVAVPHHPTLAHYGVTPEAAGAAMPPGPSGAARAAALDELLADAGQILPPFETAKAIVFHHPEIGTANPTVAQQVFARHVKDTQDFRDLVRYISQHGPGDATTWYQKSYATWVDPQTGKEGFAEADTEQVDKDGKPIPWPRVDGKAVIPQYDLTDEYNAQDPGVIGAAAPVVHQVLRDTKNDPTLNGHLWTTQQGTTQRSQTQVAPAPHAAAARAAASLRAAPKGWTIKNQTSSYGLYVYPDQLTYDAATKQLAFPVKNWPNRYLGAYVEFIHISGAPIERYDIPGWYDDLPEFLRGFFEPSPSKNYLSWISSGNQVFGIPFPTNPVTLQFAWPEDATKARVLLGGLGAGRDFLDWDSDVDVLGVLSTGAIIYGLTSLSIAFTVYVLNPILSLISSKVLYAIYGIGAGIGIVAGIAAGVEYKTSAGKYILSYLAKKVAGIFFSVAAKSILTRVYKDAIAELVLKFWSLISAEEALEQIPFAGWALQAASVAADIAALAATTEESLASPATYELEILRTLDLTVTVTPDPAHGKPGHAPVWPLVGDHYVISVVYPGTPGEEGGTTYRKAGPLPGDRTAPIVVTFAGLPAGGSLAVAAEIYSATNWLAGRWTSYWMRALPDANDELKTGGAIVEQLVPLTPTTTYSQKQRLVYDGAHERHRWQATQFAIDAALASALDARTVSPALRAAFEANGSALSADQVTVTATTPGSAWQLVDRPAGTTYAVNRVHVYNTDNQTLDELRVQNVTDAAPRLPATLQDCTTDGDNHNLCERVGIAINDKEYQLGYTWRASGQNLPVDMGDTPVNDQVYAFQSLSTLGAPEEQFLAPARGFSQRPHLAYDQFGLTPLFTLPPAPYQAELNAGGALPTDLAQAFATYNPPQGARITPVTADRRWTIGVPGSAPLFDLRAGTAVVNGATTPVINVYGAPVPGLDNFYLDPRTRTVDQRYHLRGVSFPDGRSTFDYGTEKSWGAFTQPNLDAVAVHPHGYVVAVDFATHKLFALRLPADAVDAKDAPVATPLSGEGDREGLMKQPVAMTITADGRILVLEQGNARIQAFDVKGNPVPSFNGPLRFTLPATFAGALDARSPNTALLQAFQQQVTPARAPLFSGDPASAGALNDGKADDALVQAFRTYAYDLPADRGKIAVLATKPGALWLLTDAVKNVTYDVRLVTDEHQVAHLFVYYAFALAVSVNAPGQEWTIADTTNALTFDVKRQVSPGAGLAVQQLVATMPLRDQRPQNVTYLDVAVETKGYIYVLASAAQPSGPPVFQLDIYNPDGAPLLGAPQTGINAAKLAVDQWRTMFTLNYDRLLGPGLRTEPGVSAWIPSTPSAPGVSGK